MTRYSVNLLVATVFSAICLHSVGDMNQQHQTAYGPTTTSQAIPSNSNAINNFADIAKSPGLSESDYIRYTEILKGPLGHWNPSIDPILALGIYADNDADRQHYARLYAKQEFELAKRTLQFQRAYHDAFNQLYPNTRLIDKSLLQPYYSHQQQKQWKSAFSTNNTLPRFQTGDRLLYFPNINCQRCGQSIQYWHSLLQSVSKSGIDVYVVGAQTADQVRQWAKTNGIDATWIKKRAVTLNIDHGLSEQLAEQFTGEASSVFLSRNQSVFALNPKHLSL